MFDKLEEKAKQMIANEEDEMALTMSVDGYLVTVIIMVSKSQEENNQEREITA